MDSLFSKFKNIFNIKSKITTNSIEEVEFYVPTPDEIDALENIILDSAKKNIPDYADRLTYGSYSDGNNTWRYNKNTNKLFPINMDYVGKKFRWHYEITKDESLAGIISLINFCNYYIETSDWSCSLRYWECPPAILFEMISDSCEIQPQLISFSGNIEIFKNDMLFSKMSI